MDTVRAFKRGALGFAAGALALALGAPMARAIPNLQLDIVEGLYCSSTGPGGKNCHETTISLDGSFNLVALLKYDRSQATTGYLLSAAIVQPADLSNSLNLGETGFGSFTVNGVEYSGTNGTMVYGTPPADGLAAGDLATHGVYDTYFGEIMFDFDTAMTVASYDVSLVRAWIPPPEVALGRCTKLSPDASGLTGDYQVHFDLYRCDGGMASKCTGGGLAPFSHDAQSWPPGTEFRSPGRSRCSGSVSSGSASSAGARARHNRAQHPAERKGRAGALPFAVRGGRNPRRGG